LYGLLIAVISLLVGGLIVHSYEWSILSVAILCSVSWSIGKILTMPYFLKQNFGITYFEFFKDGMVLPIVQNIPLLVLMGVARVLFEQHYYWLMVLSMLMGFTITAYIYWKYLFTDSMREDLLRMLMRLRKRKQ